MALLGHTMLNSGCGVMRFCVGDLVHILQLTMEWMPKVSYQYNTENTRVPKITQLPIKVQDTSQWDMDTQSYPTVFYEIASMKYNFVSKHIRCNSTDINLLNISKSIVPCLNDCFCMIVCRFGFLIRFEVVFRPKMPYSTKKAYELRTWLQIRFLISIDVESFPSQY